MTTPDIRDSKAALAAFFIPANMLGQITTTAQPQKTPTEQTP